jgi:fucose permease
MSKELKLSAKDYSNAANIFLVGYVVFQLPGTVLLKKIGPPWQFATAILMVSNLLHKGPLLEC